MRFSVNAIFMHTHEYPLLKRIPLTHFQDENTTDTSTIKSYTNTYAYIHMDVHMYAHLQTVMPTYCAKSSRTRHIKGWLSIMSYWSYRCGTSELFILL